MAILHCEVMQRNLCKVLSRVDTEARLMILHENETREGSSQGLYKSRAVTRTH
jgi:hypothetical protein